MNSSRSVVAKSIDILVLDGYIELMCPDSDDRNWWIADRCTICDEIVASFTFSSNREWQDSYYDLVDTDEQGDVEEPTIPAILHFQEQHEDVLTLCAMKACI